jgi:hypothetical protein
MGYKDPRKNIYRMLHPVSILSSSKQAVLLSRNWPEIRHGLRNELTMECEIRAIVENSNAYSTRAVEARRVMEDAGIRVDPVDSLWALAADAELALRA